MGGSCQDENVGTPNTLLQALKARVFGHTRGKCLTLSAISSCHPLPPSSPQKPPYNLTSGPVAGSAGPKRTGPQDVPPSNTKEDARERSGPGHLPSRSSRS